MFSLSFLANTLLVLGFIFLAIYGLRIVGNLYAIIRGWQIKVNGKDTPTPWWVVVLTIMEVICVIFFLIVFLFDWHWV